MNITIEYKGHHNLTRITSELTYELEVDIKSTVGDILNIALDFLIEKHIEKNGSSSNNGIRFGLYWRIDISFNKKRMIDFDQAEPFRFSMSETINKQELKSKIINKLIEATSINQNLTLGILVNANFISTKQKEVNLSNQEDIELMNKLQIKPITHFFKNQNIKPNSSYSIDLRLKEETSVKAYAIYTINSFIIKKHSEMLANENINLSIQTKKERQNLIENKIVVLENDRYIFQDDYKLNSYRISAEIIFGRKIESLLVWITENNTQLKDIISR
ncbi:MAG: DUF4357 domain-containing protein [Bacteroidales bacterium]